ncbi:MAG: T9SS type A sorting domain-containing protein [Bacteroidota bacterium]
MNFCGIEVYYASYSKEIKMIKHFSLSVLFALILFDYNAQNFYGNVANSVNESLSYSNVEVYQGNNLVANVITDLNGNFSLQLDSGLYRIEVLNSGYKKETFDLNINGDINKDFKLNDDPNGKKRRLDLIAIEEEKEAEAQMLNEVVIVAEKAHSDNTDVKLISPPQINVFELSSDDLDEVSISRDSKRRKTNKISKKEIQRIPQITESTETEPNGYFMQNGSYGTDGEMLSNQAMIDKFEKYIGYTQKRKSEGKKFEKGLTAGEINDFSKWKLWEDIVENKLYVHQRLWQIVPKHRYMVQVIDENASPIVNAHVELIGAQQDTLWRARTDNTGKAELWGNTEFYVMEKFQAPSHIQIHYGKQKKKISNPSTIEKGVNTAMLKSNCDVSNTVDIAFAVDATGSMGDEIDFLKKEIAEIMYRAKGDNKKLLMRFANVFYRDHGDEYLTRHSDFTKVLSETGAFIDQQDALGGGDGPEAVDEALDLAINQLTWTEDARAKILFLVLDAPPHNRKDRRERIKKLMKTASAKGIRIVPITGSGLNKSTEYLMRCLALCTNGTYTFLTDHSGIGESHIDPTTDSYDVRLMTDLMVEIIQNYAYVPECEEETPSLEVNLPDSALAFQIEPDSSKRDTTTQHILNTFIDDNPKVISWKYWPNPTMGDLNIEVSESVERLYLSDMNGKLIREIEMNGAKKTYINLEGLSTGIYLLRYPVGKKWISGKVVLTR